MAGKLLLQKPNQLHSAMNFFKLFCRQSCSRIFAEMAALSLLIGLADYLTGYEISFFIFYGIPIFVTAWCCDKKLSILTALLAGIIWWWADLQAGHPYLDNWHEGWETIVRLGFFIFTAIGSSALKEQRSVVEARLALLEHTQRLEHEIIAISEREQRRIGQDLHDGLCQFLAGIGCAAASLRGDLDKLNLPIEAGIANELATLLQDAVVQTRNLARGLVPLKIDEVGLASALEELTISVSRLTGTQCVFESSASRITLDDVAAMHLYRITQEAINNAMKHGKARQIAVSLGGIGRTLTLRIADNGTGIAASPGTSRGMGLNIMKYRARLAGGELRVEPGADSGTIVCCQISPQQNEMHERAA
jgi:signal transduction histidine kinase